VLSTSFIFLMCIGLYVILLCCRPNYNKEDRYTCKLSVLVILLRRLYLWSWNRSAGLFCSLPRIW